MKSMKWKLAALAAAAILAACGDNETADGPSNKVGINAMVSFGDSLSDIGSYNVGSIAGLGAATGGAGRFTVNDTAGGQIWTERIAALRAPRRPACLPTFPVLPARLQRPSQAARTMPRAAPGSATPWAYSQCCSKAHL
jgi:hypothetical protein